MDGGRKKPGPSPRAAHWLRGEEAPGGKDAAKKRFPTLPTHPHVMLNHTDYETTYEGAPATRPKVVRPRAARGEPGLPARPSGQGGVPGGTAPYAQPAGQSQHGCIGASGWNQAGTR